MNIAAKAGGKGFKIYGVAYRDYLINFLFSSKVILLIKLFLRDYIFPTKFSLIRVYFKVYTLRTTYTKPSEKFACGVAELQLLPAATPQILIITLISF